jgi:hypothetical protein
MAISVADVLADLPLIIDLVSVVEAAVPAVEAAASFEAKVKALEPVLEKAAAIVDAVKAQIASGK